MQTCIAALGSMTQVLGAQRALARAAIRSSVVKLDAKYTTKGCTYGLEFPCAQQNNVRTILQSAGIPIKQMIGGGETP